MFYSGYCWHVDLTSYIFVSLYFDILPCYINVLKIKVDMFIAKQLWEYSLLCGGGLLVI